MWTHLMKKSCHVSGTQSRELGGVHFRNICRALNVGHAATCASNDVQSPVEILMRSDLRWNTDAQVTVIKNKSSVIVSRCAQFWHYHGASRHVFGFQHRLINFICNYLENLITSCCLDRFWPLPRLGSELIYDLLHELYSKTADLPTLIILNPLTCHSEAILDRSGLPFSPHVALTWVPGPAITLIPPRGAWNYTNHTFP